MARIVSIFQFTGRVGSAVGSKGKGGKVVLRLLKFCREKGHDYNDILDAVKRIRMRGARHLNFDQIKVAMETRDDAPLVFADSQKTDEFIEIELGSGDVLSQLDGIMQGGNADKGRRTAV